jgi:hypothetical protein
MLTMTERLLEIRWIKLAFAALALFAVLVAGAMAKADEPNWHQVRLLGFKTGPGGIAFQVPTGGCLKKTDFAARALRDGSGPVYLQLLSARVDNCRGAFPYGTTIRFSYDEMGIQVGESFVILNEGGVVNRAGFVEALQSLEP